MSGSGTDKTKSGRDLAGPIVILVEPQLGENIGMAARAMGNFALARLRIVNPRDGWPNVGAQRAAAGADHILDRVELFDTVEQAVADCTLLFATTARAHDQAKPVVAPEAAVREMAGQIKRGSTVGILEGRKGPAKGGVLDGEQATRLRALLAEHGQGTLPSESGTVRGLARLLRRNPTDAERILWQALTTDRRFAGQFKRQTPVGRHIPDFVSFVHRIAIELINRDEGEVIGKDRIVRQSWLEARGYRVIRMAVGDVENDVAAELDRLASTLLETR